MLKELEGKKSKIIGCVGGVADDEVPVGEENGILRCGGRTVRKPSGGRGWNPSGRYGQVAARACKITKVLPARACTKVLRIALPHVIPWIVDGINLVASPITEDSNFHRSCCLFYRDLVMKIYSDTIYTVYIKMSQVRHTFKQGRRGGMKQM